MTVDSDQSCLQRSPIGVGDHVAEVQGTVAPLPDCRAADIFYERASFRMCIFRVHRVYGEIVLTLLAEFITG